MGKSNEFFQRELDLDISDKQKNILAISKVGGLSHLKPMLEICKILEDRGYKVTLAAPGNFTAKSTLYNSIPQIITDGAHDTHESTYKKSIFDKFDIKSMDQIKMKFINQYVEDFNKYLQAFKETKADLFLCDWAANDACFDLAWKLNKPVIGIVSDTRVISLLPPFLSDPMMDCHVNMENESFYNRFICAVIQPLRNSWHNQKFLNYLNNKRIEVGVSKHNDFRGRVTNTLFLIDNFFGFQIPYAMPPIHQEIGPILPDTFPNLSSDLNLFLSTHPKTMYISFGTSVYTTPENYAILIQSILELINQKILDGVIWATVLQNESELPSTFTLSTGDVIPTSNILNNLYPHIHIMKFAPQFAILYHKNTKLFLSNGGVGSCHESMYTATPMLILPIAYDQPANAEQVELTGMSLTLSKLDLKVDDVISKVIRLMNEKSFKMNAERMQVLAKFNSKRKHRGADLIEIVMNVAKINGDINENNELEIDNEVLLRHWITPDSRMGFIRGNYLDVFGTFVIIGMALIGSFGYGFYKTIKFAFKRWPLRGGNLRDNSLKRKNE
ncbi:14915_t:CDS:2 [Gigaspora margarita]|uniref:14915_t:CDS:1 n=1 Tax=Gigaspora margarita TaxID=4874 RepID=A0ABN7VRN4_GIGMA|nr:14915_t:CDS:2 [Gigaspora margarita]